MRYRTYGRGGFLSAIPPGVRWIIIICIVINILQRILPQELSNFITYHLALSRDGIMGGGFKFWQFLTYVFLHDTNMTFPAHLVFNMYGIFLFGRELEEFWGTRNFLKFFLITGIGAGIFIFLLDVLSVLVTGDPTLTFTLGASGALFALMVAYALYYPERELMLIFPPIPIKVKWIIIAYGCYELWQLVFSRTGNVSHSGHIGGIIAAYIFFRVSKKNHMYRVANNALDSFFTRIKDLLFPNVGKPKSSGSSRGGRIFDIKGKEKRSDSLNEREMTDDEIEERIDQLLDKIKAQGLNSLTIEEKLFLDRVSRLYRHKFPD